MLIQQVTMDRIHSIQIEMWKELSRILDEMGIRYYFVHGSLLGAVTREGFVPEDDDIDIAIFRKDYERLLQDGNHYLGENYFLQYSLNDDFPLQFAKFRKSDTAFIQPVLQNYKCNKGIYIDIFPIDYWINDKWKRKWFQIRIGLLNTRILSRMLPNKSLKAKVSQIISRVVFPSERHARIMREKMYSRLQSSDFINITNGKTKEQRIPAEWFLDYQLFPFCGLNVQCPKGFNDYLACIYGKTYSDYNPAESRIDQNGEIEISADTLDLDQSYTHYL